LVEFALIAPLLFLLLFGIVEFARLAHGFTTVWSAAREGARLPNYLDCDQIIETALAKVVGMTLSTGDVEITYSDLTGTPVADCDTTSPLPAPSDTASVAIDNGFTIAVTVNGTFDAIVPVTSSFLDGIDLSSTQIRSIFKGVVGE
jgi:Flp pilus assembly protein TadG